MEPMFVSSIYIDIAVKLWRNIATATAESRHSRQLIQQDNGAVKLLTTPARCNRAIPTLTANGIVYRGAYDTHTLVNSLHVLHHLIETAHEVSAVDLRQGGMVPAERLGLVYELLPAGVAGEQGPLFPSAENDR